MQYRCDKSLSHHHHAVPIDARKPIAVWSANEPEADEVVLFLEFDHYLKTGFVVELLDQIFDGLLRFFPGEVRNTAIGE